MTGDFSAAGQQAELRAPDASMTLAMAAVEAAIETIFGRRAALVVIAFEEGEAHFTALRMAHGCPLRLAQVSNHVAQALVAEWQAKEAVARARSGMAGEEE